MALALWHWHIGLTGRCTLRCPRCVRTEIPESITNRELSLSFFHKNFTEKFVNEHVERITFCGNDGDPIYASNLISVIQYFKSIKPVSITIVTNGSHKKRDFWIELGKTLTSIDSIHFSIDGYDNESNNMYRINSNYDSIMEGVSILRRVSNCYMFHSSILFKFNENYIDKMKENALRNGFDAFQLTHSTKFRKYNTMYPENDPLQPDSDYTLDNTIYKRSIWSLSRQVYPEPYKKTETEHFNKTENINDIFPLCFTGIKGLYIDPEGYFYPCCWVANKYPHNKIWNERRINLNEHNLEDVVKLDFFKNKFLEDSNECIIKCSKNNLSSFKRN